MNNKRNVIVMFLFVMLSFAIISEVSAVSDAEADGTGFDPSVKSVDMTNHDFAGERDNMQDHDNDFDDEFESHNEQNSFDKAPDFNGDQSIRNENFYEHDMNDNDSKKDDFDFRDMDAREKPLDNMSGFGPEIPENFNMTGEMPMDNMSGFAPGDVPVDRPLDNMSGFAPGDMPVDRPLDNMSGFAPGDVPVDRPLDNMSGFAPENMPGDFNMSDARPIDDINGNSSNFKFDQPKDLRDNNFTAVQNGEAVHDIAANLSGLNKIMPNMTGPNPDERINDANQPGFDDKNSSAMLPADIKKPKDIKKNSKAKNKKKAKKSKAKKAKALKKSKKMKKSLRKNSKKERAKL